MNLESQPDEITGADLTHQLTDVGNRVAEKLVYWLNELSYDELLALAENLMPDDPDTKELKWVLAQG